MLLATVKSAHEPDCFVVFVEMHYGTGEDASQVLAFTCTTLSFKGVGKTLPQLYNIKIKICFDPCSIDIGVAMAL